MGLAKQAKILTNKQVEAVYQYLGTMRNGLRNQVIFLLSVKAGLRAKEIAALKWSMVTNADGDIGVEIHLTDAASKGRGGRVIPLNRHLREKLTELFEEECDQNDFDISSSHVIRTERAQKTTSQAIVNMFVLWYADIGLTGCSSHSGRRTFITNAARKISSVGGSLRDVQALAGHSSLAVTQRYIEGDGEARVKVVELV
ncbi:tyrosine-type recombinase/integrase [Lentibacter algarum]|uniref:tyrosine-type recombinase/integrase n=1 Tax=Lentibacter algarum TaxID=576131 RepID=UPI0024903ADB|nr:site-specific integrase [Lentibacter algarum]